MQSLALSRHGRVGEGGRFMVGRESVIGNERRRCQRRWNEASTECTRSRTEHGRQGLGKGDWMSRKNTVRRQGGK